MANVVVEHIWNEDDKEDLFKVVSSIVEMKNNKSLPEGFNLNSIDVLGGENRAICHWEVPSKDAMVNLLGQVNPPSKHNVYETQKVL